MTRSLAYTLRHSPSDDISTFNSHCLTVTTPKQIRHPAPNQAKKPNPFAQCTPSTINQPLTDQNPNALAPLNFFPPSTTPTLTAPSPVIHPGIRTPSTIPFSTITRNPANTCPPRKHTVIPFPTPSPPLLPAPDSSGAYTDPKLPLPCRPAPQRDCGVASGALREDSRPLERLEDAEGLSVAERTVSG